MGIKTVTAYSLVCDGCKKEYEADSWSIWLEQDQLVEIATDSEWTTDGTIWHCWDCPTLAQCECCKQPAGEYPGERDNYCQVCWDSIEAGDGVLAPCTVNHVGVALDNRVKVISSDVTIQGYLFGLVQ